jgi:hypothetical protein
MSCTDFHARDELARSFLEPSRSPVGARNIRLLGG